MAVGMKEERVEVSSLIEDVAGRIEALFVEMWPYQDQQVAMKTAEIMEQRAHLEALDKLPEAEKLEAAKAAQARYWEAFEKVREISAKITAELERLTEDTFPRQDPATPQRMYDFLGRFSRAYTRQKKQRSAGPILEYLYTACDHAYWLWKEWIASCLAVGDFWSAEQLLAVCTDGAASSSQAHRFNTEGGAYKPSIQVAKGMIALKRDGDLDLAAKYAQAARVTFSDSREAVEFYHAVNYIRREVEEGRLKLEHTGMNGSMRAQLDRIIPPVALITGKWKEGDNRGRGEEGGEEHS